MVDSGGISSGEIGCAPVIRGWRDERIGGEGMKAAAARTSGLTPNANAGNISILVTTNNAVFMRLVHTNVND